MRVLPICLVAALLGACSANDDTAAVGDSGGTGDDASSGGDDAPSSGDGGSTGDSSVPDGPGSDAQGVDAPTSQGVPPFGQSSNGSGGAAPVNGTTETTGSVSYNLIVPGTYAPSTPNPLLVVYSGTEGAAQMTQNLENLGQQTNTASFIFAVLDGVTYNGDGTAGATALDDVRAHYDIDNDRTYLLGESAGTTAALALGFHLRQSYFAAYWANDVNASDSPAETAAELGFAPWGQAGPGGDLPDAQAIVSAMTAAGYRLPNPAPYNGAGSGTHGDINQFIAAVSFFPGKSRK